MKPHRKGFSRQRRRTYAPRPRKQKTFDEVATLQPNEYYATPDGIYFSLESTMEPIAMGELLTRFYNRNEGQNPLVQMLQPDVHSPVANMKIWQVVMRGSFYLDIESNQETHGPHRCRLWFRTFTPPIKTIWLASVQLMAFYYNEEEIRNAIKQAVDQREFFMLPSNRDILIQP